MGAINRRVVCRLVTVPLISSWFYILFYNFCHFPSTNAMASVAVSCEYNSYKENVCKKEHTPSRCITADEPWGVDDGAVKGHQKYEMKTNLQ